MSASVPSGEKDLAPETRRLYATDWAGFVAWARRERRAALPAEPDLVAAYLTSLLSTLRPGALSRRAAAIGDQHRRHGHPSPAADPAVTAVLRAARAAAPPSRRPKRAGATQMQRMAAACPGDLAGLRDRSLLLLALATAPEKITRAALLQLDAEHVRFTAGDVVLLVADRND